MTLGTARIIRGNALALPLDDESVDLVVTSPPYFGLRSYQDTPDLCPRCLELVGQGWEFYRPRDRDRDLRQAWPDWDAHVAAEHKPAHYDGQIGAEATPTEFVDALIRATAEMVRVLKPSGSIWVNLGDKYNSGSGAGPQSGLQGGDARTRGNGRGSPVIPKTGLPPKTLLGIPWRYALRAIDDLGLILRAEIIWSKSNGLPESVTDRVRRSHETWFHFTKSPRYFSAVDEIREAHESPVTFGRRHDGAAFGGMKNGGGDGSRHTDGNPLGKLPSSVWSIEEDRVSLVRSVLSAIHAGALTIDEGERILTGAARWTGSNDSGARSTRAVTVGFGLPAEPPKAMESSGSTVRRCSHTVSPTPSTTEHSPATDSSLTTSVEYGTASGTLSRSPSARTSTEGRRPRQLSTQPRHTAPTDTSSTQPTPTSSLATEVACVECACEPATGSDTTAYAPTVDVPGSVWEIPTSPLIVPDHLGVDHYAAFPIEWPRRIIRGWSPSGVCTACGEGRRPTISREASARWPSGESEVGVSSPRADSSRASTKRMTLGAVSSSYTLTGYACACPDTTAPTTPAVILDPFGGTGTTALAAKALGRHGISIDMSADYCRLATWRTTDPGQLASALQVDKPAPVAPDQLDLLEGLLA